MRLECVNPACDRSGRKSGMTILEVVIALSIFIVVAAAGIFAIITQSKRLSDSARDHYQAINLAKSRLERAQLLATRAFSTLASLAETNLPVNVNGGIVSAEEAMFRRTTAVTNIATNLTEIIVTVDIRNRNTWNFDDGTNTIREVLRTYYTPFYTPP